MTTTDKATISPVLVTGDAGIDLDTYLHFDGPNPPPDAKPTLIRRSLGGAGLSHGILTAWAGQMAPSALGFAKPRTLASPVFAVWRLKPLEDEFKKKDGKIENVWRLSHSVNPGQLDGAEQLAFPAPDLPPEIPDGFAPKVILLQDDAASFRHTRGATLTVESAWKRQESFVVWKMSPPFCRGELWWKAVAAGIPGRTAVVITLDDLRATSARISCGISWERTALEIAHELECNPSLVDLRAAEHVVVVIHGEGALWRRKEAGRTVFTLFFDAAHLERETCKTEKGKAHAYGYTSTFAAALAAGCATAETDIAQALRRAIPNGLHAMRALHALGHGGEKSADPGQKTGKPGFPFDALAAVIRCGKKGVESLKAAAFADYAEAEIPAEEAARMDSPWSIALGDESQSSKEPLCGLARRVAVFGMRELRGVPHATFGKLLTADRNEIEALRNLKTLIDNYKNDREMDKPLSLAVFGPPGAGKSFGVKQIAKEVLGKECPILEFNLSQFTEADLAGAFHQVRDKVLEGRLPVVFWDEFDSSEYKWLQRLLAPMNDGKFQEGQITHPVGRCVFVFAGGTSHDMAHFGPPQPASDAPNESRETQAWTAFKLLKGPDFISRIHGALNVLGPNPKATAEGEHRDVGFPLRRAILLRALLGCKDDQRLDMDAGLLAALLEVGDYTNGARSFEKVCLALVSSAKGRRRYLPSDLPSDAVLGMNVTDLAEFRALLTRDSDFQKFADILAPAIHRSYLPLSERDNPNAKPYGELSEETKADNLAAARRIPWLLGLAGLYIADTSAEGALTREQALAILGEPDMLERLAEEEHDQWMLEKRNNGWILGERDDVRHVHPLLILYRELVHEQKEKDRKNVCGIPERVELAGLAIVAQKPILTK